MATAFIYRLELTDGTPADPPTISSAPGVRSRAGDTIPHRALGVVRVRDDDADQPPAMVVKDMNEERLALRG
jgi:hypothetical protein